MLYLVLLGASLLNFPCHGDRVCNAANEFAARYADWTKVVNAVQPGTVDAREPSKWLEVSEAFKRLGKERKNNVRLQ